MRAIECIPKFLWNQLDGKAISILEHLEIKGISLDSRIIQKGDLFIALDGEHYPATSFIKNAIQKGAVAILLQRREKQAFQSIEEEVEEKDGLFYIQSIPLLFTTIDPRFIIGYMAAYIYPKKPRYLFAVTGTNGKTSVSFFVRDIMVGLGFSAAALGTVGTYIKREGEESIEKVSSLTTPDPISLHKALQSLYEKGINAVALEASSHGLHQGRLLGVSLSAGGFTNFTPEHLDYHPTMEEYFQAKTLLFKDILRAGQVAVLNADIPEYPLLKATIEQRQQRLMTYGYRGDTFQFKSIKPGLQGSSVDLDIETKPYTLFLPIIGEFQVYNIFCALGMVMGALGIHTSSPEFSSILKTLSLLKAPPGRLEYVGKTPKGATLYVDYAHTPDAFERVLKTLRPYVQGNLWILFGCGGDRDPYKRPLMGKMASLYADYIVLTDDNPRTEDPNSIRKMIKVGITKANHTIIEIPDRRQALFKVIPLLKNGDLLLLAGKGHQEEQIIGREIFSYNDGQTAKEILQQLQAIKKYKEDKKNDVV